MADLSHADRMPFRCDSCRREQPFDVWVVVDASHRVDLLQMIANGTLHAIFCPCGVVTAADAPLLLYSPAEDPPMFFSPAEGTSDEEDMAHAGRLLGWLAAQLGDAWDDSWVFLTDPIPRPELEAFVAENWVRLSGS